MALLRTLLAALLVATPLYALAADEKKTDAKTDQKKQDDKKADVTVTAKDDGSKVTVKKGGTVEVKLKGQPGTGFTWVARKLDRKILKPAGKPKLVPIDKDKAGGDSWVIQRFAGVEEGEAKLELRYKRPLNKDSEDDKKFVVTVVVK